MPPAICQSCGRFALPGSPEQLPSLLSCSVALQWSQTLGQRGDDDLALVLEAPVPKISPLVFISLTSIRQLVLWKLKLKNVFLRHKIETEAVKTGWGRRSRMPLVHE